MPRWTDEAKKAQAERARLLQAKTRARKADKAARESVAKQIQREKNKLDALERDRLRALWDDPEVIRVDRGQKIPDELIENVLHALDEDDEETDDGTE